MDKSAEKWLKDYESAERLVQNVSQNLNERSKYPKSSTNYSKLSSNIRNAISNLDTSANALARGLDETRAKANITQQEFNRRQNLLNQLRRNQKQFEQALRDDSSSQKDALMYGGSSEINETVGENRDTEGIGSEQLLHMHDRVIAEQDQGLETLSHIIKNQRQIALTIGNEVDRQNDMMDSMGNRMDQVHDRLIRETKHVRLISFKSGTCGLWMIIVLLLIAIIVIAAIPKVK